MFYLGSGANSSESENYKIELHGEELLALNESSVPYVWAGSERS